MSIFFTADTHFFHKNILKYSNRPFANINEMNETIISNWNNVVGKHDVVYHLGDFMLSNNQGDFYSIFERLNGYIILIKGNHDGIAWKNRKRFTDSYDTYAEVEVNDHNITLCHYKMAIWNQSHFGAYHLYGHSHGTAPNLDSELSFDVGVDCHNFTPISMKKVEEIIGKKKFKPIDHHG